jgi:general nucleoside transport system permease protein
MRTAFQDHWIAQFATLLDNVVRVTLALLVSVIITGILVRLVGGNVLFALRCLVDGAFGNTYSFGTTLVATTPLLLTGLGVGVAFRCRMWNIGGEGQYLIGCLACSATALNCPWTAHLPAVMLVSTMLVAAFLAGGAWAAIAAALKLWRSVPEVISTIMLNFIAFELLSYLVNGPLQRPDRSQPATAFLDNSARLPLLSVLNSVFRGTPLHVGCLLAVIVLVLVYVLLNSTRFGFSTAIVGANSTAAELAGIPVKKTLLVAMLLSGSLCGLAGGVELCGNIGCVYEGYQPGYGFEAVAVALLGKLSPLGICMAALFVGALSVGCQNMERTAGIAHETGLMIQALALLTLLVLQWKGWSLAPISGWKPREAM